MIYEELLDLKLLVYYYMDMGWTIGVLGFDSRLRLGIFLSTAASRTVLGPTQPPIQWVPGVLSVGVKRLRLQADHSPPSSTEVKECVELYLHSPSRPPWRVAQLKHRDNFTSLLHGGCSTFLFIMMHLETIL
jgi:hypothetical protein